MDTVIAEQHSDAGGTILLLIPDVFFAVTVRNAVRRIGYEPRIVTTTDALVVSAGEHQAVLAIIDLAAVRSDEWGDIGDLVRDGLPALVFGAHKDVAGLRAAKAAGVTRVVSNGQFHREMAELIERYALGSSCALGDDPLDIDAPLGSLPPGMRDHLPDVELEQAIIEK